MSLEKMILAMQNCYQIPGKQTVWEHCTSVKDNLLKIHDYCKTGLPLPSNWIIPCWLNETRVEIGEMLYDRSILERYAQFHDCGKPYCEEKCDDG